MVAFLRMRQAEKAEEAKRLQSEAEACEGEIEEEHEKGKGKKDKGILKFLN
jgi:hypothetical protein